MAWTGRRPQSPGRRGSREVSTANASAIEATALPTMPMVRAASGQRNGAWRSGLAFFVAGAVDGDLAGHGRLSRKSATVIDTGTVQGARRCAAAWMSADASPTRRTTDARPRGPPAQAQRRWRPTRPAARCRVQFLDEGVVIRPALLPRHRRGSAAREGRRTARPTLRAGSASPPPRERTTSTTRTSPRSSTRR